MIDVEQTIISQYGNSPTLLQMIRNMNAYIDPSADIDNFFSFIWNVDSAQGFGLDVWGRIVGIDREVLTNPIYYLDDDAYRKLIYLKALSNISATTAPAINQLLRNWIGDRGKAFVSDPGGMSIIYNFEFPLQPYERLIVQNSAIFLRPAGVNAKLSATTYPVFGFAEMGTKYVTGFNQAAFVGD